MSAKSLVVVAVFFLSTGWTIRNLGTFPAGGTSSARGVNKHGQVAGHAHSSTDGQRAVYWDADGTMHEIPTPVCASCMAMAEDINDSGVVAGTRIWEAFPVRQFGFIWHPGTPGVTDYLAARPSGDSTAYAINSFNDVGGSWDDDRGIGRAVLWRGGVPAGRVEIGRPDGNVVTDVADAPVVVGQSGTVAGGRPRFAAFLWIDGRMRDLGMLPGDDASCAYGVTFIGDWRDEKNMYVVGDSQVLTGARPSHAFIWHRGVMTNLGSLPGTIWCRANAINQSLDVVGWCSGDGVPPRAFLWRAGVMTDLNDLLPANSGWQLESALDINVFGQIVGAGRFQGAYRAFIMTP